MLFQRINRTDAEKVFVVLQNVSGGTISAGGVVSYDLGASVDGVRVSTPATTNLGAVAGAAAEAIVDSAYGKVQVFGYNSAVYVTNTTDVALAAGDVLIPVNAATYLIGSTQNTAASIKALYLGGFRMAEAFATATTPAVATKKVFIKCL